MPELRIDPITARRVYVAEDRAGRPFDYVDPPPARAASRAVPCPFCAGNEALTPEASAAICDAAGRWQVRVVPNKFPAVTLGSASAIGAHEVIIESPEHLFDFDQLEVAQLVRVFQVYQDRLRHWAADGRLAHALIFKNSGHAAGASLEHVHSQLLATPYVHDSVDAERRAAQQHFSAHKRCIYCDLMQSEIAEGDRLVQRESGFVTVCAYAGRQPYEIWILPEDHAAQFEDMSEVQATGLARVLQDLLARLKQASTGAAYNLVLHSAPVGGHDNNSYHWHWELLPRITQLAGLELGGGTYINPVAPERAARHLRAATPHVRQGAER
jgi:UDPglucose--hexose-1-phosphate uridylyltransferase